MKKHSGLIEEIRKSHKYGKQEKNFGVEYLHFDCYPNLSSSDPYALFSYLIKNEIIIDSLKKKDIKFLGDKLDINILSIEPLKKKLLTILVEGGAYNWFGKGNEVGKIIINDFLSAFTKKKFIPDLECIFISGNSITNWHYSIGWDYVCILLDKNMKQTAFLFITDTD